MDEFIEQDRKVVKETYSSILEELESARSCGDLSKVTEALTTALNKMQVLEVSLMHRGEASSNDQQKELFEQHLNSLIIELKNFLSNVEGNFPDVEEYLGWCRESLSSLKEQQKTLPAGIEREKLAVLIKETEQKFPIAEGLPEEAIRRNRNDFILELMKSNLSRLAVMSACLTKPLR